MKMRTLRSSESLDSVAEELLFTESRLGNDEHGKEFVPVISGLAAQVDQARSGQVGAWREEVIAHAAVAAADDLLDDWIAGFARALADLVNGNKESPLYRRYFPTAPWTFIRLGLESELSRVRGWVDSLATEPQQTLKDRGASLPKLIAQSDAALERRRKAVSARSDHRVRSITSLIEEINTARAALYGALATKAAEAGLPIDWPARFFRRSTRAKDEAPEPSETAPTTPTNGASAQGQT